MDNWWDIEGKRRPVREWMDSLNQDECWPDWCSEMRSFLRLWAGGNRSFQVPTSGSTGEPSLIELPRRQMERSAQRTAKFFGLGTGSVALHVLPSGYISGKMMLVRSLVNGWNLLIEKPDGYPLKGLTIPVDFVALTPMQLSNSLRDEEEKLRLVKIILLGGAGSSTELEQSIDGLSQAVYLGYGMTETSSHIALRKLNGEDAALSYTGLEGYEFSVNEEECLIIQNAEEGIHLITRDVVQLIDPHHFIWKGRADDVVNSGGIKIHPAELEKAIEDLIPAPFYLCGAADPVLGERLVLVMEGLIRADGESLLKAITGRVGAIRTPKEIRYMTSFERTVTNKIKRVLPQ